MKSLYQTWVTGGSGYAVIQDQQIVEERTTDLTDNYLWDSGGNKYTCLDADIESDRQAIADGKIPYCIVNGSSGVHMLSKPSAAVANEVIKRLYELGIVDEIKHIDVSTIQDAENADINEPDYGS